ncbi:MAG: acetyl-CoA carboxylase biotin carboxyl carrier protein [Candidatus Omnitrophica bacterium]|nr:acetyl-CoA carboxylase biotin carboxyl carrier protein [Candidatus Omnitrophota bacterium]
MNLKEIKELLQLMEEHQLNEIEIEKDGTKIKMRKGPDGRIISEEMMQSRMMMPAAVHMPTSAPVGALPETPLQEDTSIVIVRSPMVGTFYSAPAPDQPPYVTMGQKVAEGDVLCIIEAMKLMNEIKCEANGAIAEILVTNGQSVEFDQPLFKIKKG